jgi:hypothetical protein
VSALELYHDIQQSNRGGPLVGMAAAQRAIAITWLDLSVSELIMGMTRRAQRDSWKGQKRTFGEREK